MWTHSDIDSRELPLSTLGMIFVFLPFILASLYFRILERMSGEDSDAKRKTTENKTTALDVTSYHSLRTLINDSAEFGLILGYCFVCEHYPPFEHGEKKHDFDVFLGSFFLLIMIAVAFTRNREETQKSAEVSVMNREQTDEWKGWMQFLFLMYHWAKVPEAYNLVRVLITAYVVFEREVREFYTNKTPTIQVRLAHRIRKSQLLLRETRFWTHTCSSDALAFELSCRVSLSHNGKSLYFVLHMSASYLLLSFRLRHDGNTEGCQSHKAWYTCKTRLGICVSVPSL